MPPIMFKTTARLKNVTKKKRVEQQPVRTMSAEPPEPIVSENFSPKETLGDTGRMSVDIGAAASSSVGEDVTTMPREMWRRWAMDKDKSRLAGWTRVKTAQGENGQPAVDGTLSKWTTRPLPEQVVEYFNVAFNEETGRFEHSPELASTVKSMKSMADSSLQASASRVFAETEDNRTKLGMKGSAVEGIKGDLVADTFREKMCMTGTMAAPGPIRTAITEKPTRPQTTQVDSLGSESGRGFAPISMSRAGRKELQFDYIGPDPYEDNMFYFSQRGKETPQRNGFQKWQLRCQRERVWKSRAPRAYGPSRERGGFWGGGLNSFTTRNLLPVERLGSAAGGEYEDVDSFFLSAIDEPAGGGMPEEWAPDAVPKFAPQRISTIHSLRPQVEAESDVPGKGVARTSVVVGRTTAGKGPTSALRFVPVASGFPSAGYPGWSMRALGPWREGTAGPGETRETAARKANAQGFVSSEDEEEGAGVGSAPKSLGDRARAPTGRLNQDTVALRNPQERARTAGRLCVELHGKSGGVYTQAGGPSNARAQSESWRMPFTQAGELPMEETNDDTLWRFQLESEHKSRSNSERDPIGSSAIQARLSTGLCTVGYSGLAKDVVSSVTPSMKRSSLWRPDSWSTRPVRGWTPQTTPVPTSSSAVALEPGIRDVVGAQRAETGGMRPVRGWHPQTNPFPTSRISAAEPGVGTPGFQADGGGMPRADSGTISGGMRPVRGWTPKPAPVDGRQSRGATVLRIGS